MTELRLKFNDADGSEKHAAVTGMKFVIGRHSASDLSIPDGRLSREHVKIERIGENFAASDLNSSNGTTLNGEKLEAPAKLKNGDTLVLGGGVKVSVEILSNAELADPQPDEPTPENPAAEPELVLAAGVAPSGAVPRSAAAPAPGGIPKSIFLIAPLLGIIILVLIGGLIYLLSSKKQPVVAQNEDDFEYSVERSRDDDLSANKKEDDSGPKNAEPSPASSTPANSGNVTADTHAPPPQATGETAKIESSGAAFLRRIAQNDPKAFLTSEQAKRLNAKVKQLGGSSAIADNINSAKKNAAKISSIASAKNLKPQFLAVAALTKLGNSRGDVVQTAASVAEIYDKLATQIGSELADDSLLMVAAYDQGAAGDNMKLRNMLQDLANKSPDSARSIRSIWFLEKNGKITQGEFERALTFLAIGTITQNPKDFGVNAEALTL